jgi:hypothetical protein
VGSDVAVNEPHLQTEIKVEFFVQTFDRARELLKGSMRNEERDE